MVAQQCGYVAHVKIKVAIVSEDLIVVESRLLAHHAVGTNGKQKYSAKTNFIGNKAESS